MAGYKHSQLKSKSYDEIQKLFDKEMKRLNTFVDMKLEVVKGSETRTEESSKRAGDELESDKSKKQKIDEHVKSKKDNDPEEEEMKKHMEIIVKEGQKGFYHLIRADGSSKRPSPRSSGHVVRYWSYDHMEAYGEPSVATSMSQFLKFLMAGGVRVGKGMAFAANEIIPQHTTPPLPFGFQILEKSDHQKVVEYENERVLVAKRKAQAAKDRAIRKRAVTDEASQCTKKKKTTPLSFTLSDSKVDGSNRSGSAEEDTDQHLYNMEDTTEVNSLLSGHSPCSQHSNPFDEDTHNMRGETTHTHASGLIGRVSSSSGGSHCQAFPRRNRGGSGIGGSLQGDMDLHVPFVPAWNLTTYSILNDTESCRDMMINLATPADLFKWDQHVVNTLKGNLESLTVDLVQAEIMRLNYVRQLLPTVFQWLLSSGEYKKNLTDPAIDYDPACKDTFMSEFDSLFNKSYPYIEKLAESFRLPLGDLQNMWPEGTGPTLSGNATDVQ
ncbi:hypothetical protein Tco_0714244 [Tanacetum coccineum]